MRWFALTCLFFLSTAQPILAGAWLRDKGTGFIATTTTVRSVLPEPDYEVGIYADYGLTEGLNSGLDIYETPGLSGHILAFVRLPLTSPGPKSKLAVELGMGAHHLRHIWRPMYRLGVSWGYGFDTKFSPGWVAAETSIEHRDGQSGPLFKFDAIAGLSSPDRIRPMLQLETAIGQNLPFQWKLTPSLMIPTKGKSTWVIGIQQRSFGTIRTGLKLALWRQF